jgi:tRNA A37 threonylcarbamoyladenosine dehydratase
MYGMSKETYVRSSSLLGNEAFERLSSVLVAIFGVGGVGGWCAEALLRTGVHHLTIVDDDLVAESNINRQRQAAPSTVGKPKVKVLRDMLLEIVPDATIDAVAVRYTPENADLFNQLLDSCDFVIDAIDSVDCKTHLIHRCTSSGGKKPKAIFSSMGAALRTDPTKIRAAPFHKVAGDGLAKALRNRFRKSGIPLPKHLCAYSEEPPSAANANVKGSIMPVTCAFGMALASLVVQASRNC